MVVAPPGGAPGGFGQPPATAPGAPSGAAKAKPKATATAKPAAPKKVASADNSSAEKGPLGIAALVNDEPVTAFQVERLAKFMALSSNIGDRARANMKSIAENPQTNERLKAILQETIKANQGKSREQVIAAFEERKKQFVLGLQRQAVDSAKASVIPGLRKKALDELIDERLKFQEAKKMTITIGEDEAERAFKGIAERNKVAPKEFEQNIRNQGADPAVMKSRLHAQLVWREVVRRRYGHMIAVSNKEVDHLIENSKGSADDLVELGLHKVTFTTTGKIDQKLLAKRVEEAEQFRGRFAGCKGLPAMVKDLNNVKHEDLGFKKAATVSEPTRSFILAAADGEMVPAVLTASGAELFAVCGRRVNKADDTRRQAAENELQMKEFERLSLRHIQDLRKDALIEIKQN